MSLANNIEFLRRLPKLNEFNRLGSFPSGLGRAAGPSRLSETTGFGTNPGDLKMFSYLPGDQRARQRLPLVVVLHGCTQNAAGYDAGAGWSTLADRYGFALLMPEQKTSNNGNGCFNWFNPEDIARGGGEALSIRQMIARMSRDHGIDAKRIFVTGLSAGGAMTSVMLATYPEVFAGGAIIAGLPYGIAANVQQALSGMYHSAARPARELGDLVRNVSSHNGPWPKISVWHGSADKTVNPSNADEIIKQWLDVHQLPPVPMAQSTVDGYPRAVWWNADGETLVESYTITDMAHGTPLGIADNDERYGAQGAFMIEAGISSSYHIACFFGLTGRVHQPKDVSKEASKPVAAATTLPAITAAPALPAPSAPEINAIPWPSALSAGPAKSRRPPRRPAIDVSAVINRALTAAGLMK
ncbi:alpha/beta hydrolase family esterase [uncultured Bradyrhizobium sp.]|uniref:extracellular catalytic domain type 1 short-chain-length polyhydroxyalkanoate depolymerase n=1 Tax=uncultured Bradyrhizobium sp. TaxID=199684 RepID=UPI0035CBA12B